MSIQRLVYNCLVVDSKHPDADPVEHRVEVTIGDRTRAELEAGRQRLPVDPRVIPQQSAVLWVWAALVRTKVVDVDYRTFRDGNADAGLPPILVGFEQVRDDDSDPDDVDAEPLVVDVDPTGAGSASPSPSPHTSATSGSGVADSGSTSTT